MQVRLPTAIPTLSTRSPQVWLFRPGNSPELLGVHDTRRGGTAESCESESASACEQGGR